MSVVGVIPEKELSIEERMSLEKDIEETLFRLAVKEFRRPRDEFIVRNGLPKTDLGFTNEVWVESITTANAYNTIVSAKEVPERTLICFYGGASLGANPLTTVIRFRKGEAKILDVWNIEESLVQEEPEFVAKSPIIYKAGDIMNVDFYGKATGTDYFVLKMKVCEPKDKLISPSPLSPESE